MIKRLSITFLFLLICIGSGNAQDRLEVDEQATRECDLQVSKVLYKASGTGQEYDLHYHRLEWQVHPDTVFIRGKITSYFITKKTNLSELQFDLAYNLEVDSVLYHFQKVPFSKSDKDVLTIALPKKLQAGVFDSVTVAYHGVPSQSGFGSFVQTKHATGNVIWTLSEPFGAKQWWPCKQDLNDKMDSIDIFVTTDSLFRVASNGVLVSEKKIGGKKTFHWKHRYPIAAYLIAIAVTDYKFYSDWVPLSADTLEVLNYVYPDSTNLADAKSRTAQVIPVMQLFSNLFGSYPFINEKYGHAQFGFGGGMEHQTMSFMNNFGRGLMAHELAHQWFGDKVTCASWKDIWLNEGFATYLAALIDDFGINPEKFKEWKIQTIANVTSSPGGSVQVDDTLSVGRIFDGRLSYSKGAYLLHMLRWKLGDSNFFTACRNYLHDSELAYGYAGTDDLKRHLEKQSGQNLDEFFKDWYEGQGFPTYKVLWKQENDGKVSVKVEQLTSHPSVDFFEMPVPLRLAGEGMDTTIVVDPQFSGAEFSFHPGFWADTVQVDPQHWILAKNEVYNLGETEGFNKVSIKVYPLIAGDQITLEFDKEITGLNTIEIVDVTGRNIKTFQYDGAAQVKKVNIDLSAMNIGMYILRVSAGAKRSALRFIKN